MVKQGKCCGYRVLTTNTTLNYVTVVKTWQVLGYCALTTIVHSKNTVTVVKQGKCCGYRVLTTNTTLKLRYCGKNMVSVGLLCFNYK